MKTKIITISALLFFQLARANTNNWYMGIGINHDAQTQWSGTNTVNGSDYDLQYDWGDNDLGYNIFVGKQLNDYFGTELEFQKLGDAAANNDGGFTEVKQELTDAYYANLWGTARYPLFQYLSMYGKLGLSYFYGEYTSTQSGVKVSEDTDNDYNLGFGIGLQADYKHAGVRIEYSRSLGADQSENPVESNYMPSIISLDFICYLE